MNDFYENSSITYTDGIYTHKNLKKKQTQRNEPSTFTVENSNITLVGKRR